MSSILKAAWRTVARRSTSDRGVLLAVFAIMLIAVALISAGPIYAGATTTSSLRRTLADADVEEASVVIETRVTPGDVAQVDQQVTSALDDVFAATGTDTFRRATSDSFGLEDLASAGDSDLVVFRSFTGIENRATLIAGAWPGEGVQRLEVAVPSPVASRFDLDVGSVFTATGRADPDVSYGIEIVGVYEVTDPNDPFWLADELDLTGIRESTSFTTHGPLVVSEPSYFTTVGSGSSSMRWSSYPRFETIEVEDIDPIVSGLGGLDAELNGGRGVGNQAQIATALDSVLRNAQRALLVTRSAVLTISVQLAVLAGYALLLAAGLLTDTREVESATITARGASTSQLVAMAGMEGLLLAIPAFALGPFLGSLALRMFNVVGPLADIGLTIEPVITGEAWLLAGLAAIACVVALVIPAYVATRRNGNVRARRSREEIGPLRRYGIDVALLGLAVLGVWQLARYGSTITTNVRGALGIDPLLVAAPAMALLAGSILALRLMPLLAHLADAPARRSKSLTGPLGIWHLGRQPKRYTRSALLLILALAIGVFALGYSRTWSRSQSDRADFAAGADIEVEPSRVAGSAIAPEYLIGAHLGIEGVVESTPNVRSGGELAGLDRPVEFILLQPEPASAVLAFRPDLAAEPFADLMGSLAAARPSLPLLELPGEPQHLAITTEFVVEEPLLEPDDDLANYPVDWYVFEPSLRAILMDSRGSIFRVDLGGLQATGSPVEMRASIGRTLPDGSVATPQYPISLVGLEIAGLAPFDGLDLMGTLILDGVRTSPDGRSWQASDLSSAAPVAAVSNLRLAAASPTAAVDDRGEAITMIIDTGATVSQTREPVYHTLWMGELPSVDSIAVLVDAGLASTLGVGEGDSVPMEDLPQFAGTGTVVGVVEAFPTVQPGESHVIVGDLATYNAALLRPGTVPPPPSRFWIDADDSANIDAISDALADEPLSSPSVTGKEQILEELTLDPVSLGTIGSLLAGLIAAAFLAGIGFLVNVVVSGRERLGQFALLKAVGMRSAQVLSWVNVENGATVGFGLAIGIALGLGLAWLVLPLTAVSEQATVITPELIVRFPWAAVIGLGLFMASLVLIGWMITRRMLRRLHVASLLRGGGE